MLGVKKFSNSEVSYTFHTRTCDFCDKIQCEGVGLQYEEEILKVPLLIETVTLVLPCSPPSVLHL